MGKNKKSKLTYLDKRYDVEIPVDSSEERDFYAWLSEA